MSNVSTILFKYCISWSSISCIFGGKDVGGKETALQFTVVQGKHSKP